MSFTSYTKCAFRLMFLLSDYPLTAKYRTKVNSLWPHSVMLPEWLKWMNGWTTVSSNDPRPGRRGPSIQAGQEHNVQALCFYSLCWTNLPPPVGRDFCLSACWMWALNVGRKGQQKNLLFLLKAGTIELGHTHTKEEPNVAVNYSPTFLKYSKSLTVATWVLQAGVK